MTTKHKNKLNKLTESYVSDPFRWTTERMLARYVGRCVECSQNRDEYLELGIGHGIVLDRLSQEYKSLTVLEGSSIIIEQYKKKYPKVTFIETLFETFKPQKKYENIGMGFVLEHVDDPNMILRFYSDYLTENGKIFIGVPSASSMHRLLGQKAGFLDDLRKLSEQDYLYGHKRYLTYEDWRGIIEAEGLVIKKQKGSFWRHLAQDSSEVLT